MIEVLDVSVAAKWFTPDGDRGDVLAEALLREIVRHPRRFVVPELFSYELLAVLCRRMGHARDVDVPWSGSRDWVCARCGSTSD